MRSITLFIPKKVRPLLFRTKSGLAEGKRVDMQKFPRRDGIATHVSYMIALRKTLALCLHCAGKKMPLSWKSRYDYAKFDAFHGDGACDYCREDKPVSLFLPEEGKYWQSHKLGQDQVIATRKRERALLEKDRRYIIGA